MTIYEVKFTNCEPVYVTEYYAARQRVLQEQIQVLEYIDKLVLNEDMVSEFVVNFLMIRKLTVEKIVQSKQRITL